MKRASSKLKKNKSAKHQLKDAENALIIKAEIKILKLYDKNGDKIPNDEWNFDDFVCNNNALRRRTMLRDSLKSMDMHTFSDSIPQKSPEISPIYTTSDLNTTTEMKHEEVSEDVAIYQLVEYGNEQPMLRLKSSSMLSRKETDGLDDMYKTPSSDDNVNYAKVCTPRSPLSPGLLPNDPVIIPVADQMDKDPTPDGMIGLEQAYKDLPVSDDEGNKEDEKSDQMLNTTDVDEKELVTNWLKNDVKLPQYLDLFFENGLEDMEVIMTLNEKDLMDVGIKKFGHRRKITMKIANELERMRLNKTPAITPRFGDGTEGANVLSTHAHFVN